MARHEITLRRENLKSHTYYRAKVKWYLVESLYEVILFTL